MSVWINIIIPIVIAITTSSGIWAFAAARFDRKNNTRTHLLAMAHDRVISTASMYIRRGWISPDEYEDYLKYVFKPYKDLGGNGLAERLTETVKKLPMSVDEMMDAQSKIVDSYFTKKKEPNHE